MSASEKGVASREALPFFRSTMLSKLAVTCRN